MSHITNFSVLHPSEFLDDVLDEAKQAKVRFWAQAMEVEPGKYVNELLTALTNATNRGMDARLHADWYSLLVTDGTFNYWPFVSSAFRKRKNTRLQKKRAMASELTEQGVLFMFTNPPTLLDRLFPTRGRNHMKIVIVDTTSWIGGINFHEDNFTARDIMIKITDPAITAELAYVYERIHQREILRDMAITISEDTKLLIDGGRINHSIILKHAVQAIKHAKQSVKVISPLLPDAEFLYELARAQKKGISVHCIAPEIKRMIGVYGLVDIFNYANLQLRRTGLRIDFKNFPIHAKILIIDDKEIIVGSHNFSRRGVSMGTEEIALQSTDKTLVANLLTYYTELESA